jgi:hypothetical protein
MMVEPVSLTISAVTTALVVKSVDRATDAVVDAGASAVGKLVEWVRGNLDHSGQTALKMLEEQPASPIWSRTFAEVIDAEVVEDPEFGVELQRRLDELKQAGVHVGDVRQVAVGDNDPQVAHSDGVTVTYGSPLPPSQPLL